VCLYSSNSWYRHGTSTVLPGDCAAVLPPPSSGGRCKDLPASPSPTLGDEHSQETFGHPRRDPRLCPARPGSVPGCFTRARCMQPDPGGLSPKPLRPQAESSPPLRPGLGLPGLSPQPSARLRPGPAGREVTAGPARSPRMAKAALRPPSPLQPGHSDPRPGTAEPAPGPQSPQPSRQPPGSEEAGSGLRWRED